MSLVRGQNSNCRSTWCTWDVSFLQGECAVLLSTGQENLDLAVALDMSVAYLGAEHMNHPFRVLESLILRIKHADAICTIEKSGKK